MSIIRYLIKIVAVLALSIAVAQNDTAANSLNQLNQHGATYHIETEENQDESKIGCLEKIGLRIFSTNEIFDGETASDNLVRLDYNGLGLAYERLNDRQGQSFGTKIPFGKFLGLRKDADLYILRFEDIENDEEEHEVIVRIDVLEDHKLDIVARGIDLTDSDGFAIASNYRQNPDIEARDNLGGGITYTELGDDNDVGVYAWLRSGRFWGLFIGAGSYIDSNRFVIGMPEKGDFTWRYFRIDKDNGFQLSEFLFSTEGTCLNSIDAWETLHANEADHTDALSRGGVYRYIPPPISGRGMGWTGGIIHTETPDGKDFLKTEIVRYIGKFFVGIKYDADLDDYGEGRAGIPTGYKFEGGDGLTRNFIRLEPFYDREKNDWGLDVIFEYKVVFF